MEQKELFIQFSYLLATLLFMAGLHKLGSPKTARTGNLFAAAAMFIGVVATLFNSDVVRLDTVAYCLLAGSIVGGVAARKVEMTEMPQLVALFNGFGGASSSLIALSEYYNIISSSNPTSTHFNTVVIMLSVLVGMVTLTGSFVAFLKLQGWMTGSPVTFPLQQIFNNLVLVSFFVMSFLLLGDLTFDQYVIAGIIIASLYGIFFVLPIGGADMPVIISFLNSLSGIAASFAGFVVNNKLLIIAGALVGASGFILTQIMCKGMNRTLGNVLFGAFGQEGGGAGSGSTEQRPYKSIEAYEAASMMAYADSVVIVPGYGMAVAQAQHAVKELTDLLEDRGVDVKFAIHPVAGRMPGHMNVLLAEANIPYDKLIDLDEINSEFPTTTVAVVIGANDVVNPCAKTDKSSPIYGMPILDVDKAQNCIIIKRSMSPGFAGIDNDLFYMDKSMMLFGSAKKVVQDAVNEIKEM